MSRIAFATTAGESSNFYKRSSMNLSLALHTLCFWSYYFHLDKRAFLSSSLEHFKVGLNLQKTKEYKVTTEVNFETFYNEFISNSIRTYAKQVKLIWVKCLLYSDGGGGGPGLPGFPGPSLGGGGGGPGLSGFPGPSLGGGGGGPGLPGLPGPSFGGGGGGGPGLSGLPGPSLGGGGGRPGLPGFPGPSFGGGGGGRPGLPGLPGLWCGGGGGGGGGCLGFLGLPGGCRGPPP